MRALQLQQVLLLKVGFALATSALSALECGPSRVARVGVFVGVEPSDGAKATPSVYSTAGAAVSVASGRLSYVLGFVGPCISLDTACSSALVAAHQAASALHRSECSVRVFCASPPGGAQSAISHLLGRPTRLSPPFGLLRLQIIQPIDELGRAPR